MDSGSAIPSTDRYELYKIPVEIPDLGIQRKIVRSQGSKTCAAVQQAIIETNEHAKTLEIQRFRGFSFCPVLAQPDPTKSFLPGTTRGQLPFFRLYGTTSGTTTGTTFRHFWVTISAFILPISFI